MTHAFGNCPIDVLTDEEADQCEYLVCVPDGPSKFDDNFKGVCCHCGITVMYRWHAPRKPKRICMECLLKMEQMLKQADSPT